MFFVVKHNTAYELRISDWSSDVCSSDLKGIRQVSPAVPDIDAKFGLFRWEPASTEITPPQICVMRVNRDKIAKRIVCQDNDRHIVLFLIPVGNIDPTEIGYDL